MEVFHRIIKVLVKRVNRQLEGTCAVEFDDGLLVFLCLCE